MMVMMKTTSTITMTTVCRSGADGGGDGVQCKLAEGFRSLFLVWSRIWVEVCQC